jgi:hypothetical protein
MSGPATPTPPVSPSYRIVADDLRKGCYLFSAPGDATPFTTGLPSFTRASGGPIRTAEGSTSTACSASA